jgi:hypothetical protein
LILEYANNRKRLIYAIRNANRIRLTRPSKNLFSFLIFNSATLIFSFFIILAARFLLSIPFKHYMYLLRRGRRLIRKGRDITGMIHRSTYLCIFIYRYAGACIRSAAAIRFGLAPYLPLAKISADL